MSLQEKLKQLKKSERVDLKDSKFQKPGTSLLPFQTVGTAFLYMTPRAILGDQTGLGKSAQSLHVAIRAKEKDPNLRIMVVCPKSSLYQWRDEGVYKFTEGLDCQLIDAEAKFKKLGYKNSQEYRLGTYREWRDFLILNYHSLRSDWEDKILPALGEDPLMVIFDEAAVFKGRNNTTFNVCLEVSLRACRVLGLTATVIKNRLEEAHAIYKVVVPGLMPTLKQFYDDFCFYRERRIPNSPFPIKEITGYKNLGKFRDLIDPHFIGRKKKEVSDQLPKLRFVNIPLTLNAVQTKVIDALREDDVFEHPLRGEVELTPLTRITYEQILMDMPSALGFDGAGPKEEALVQMLTGELLDNKVIVYCFYAEVIESLAKQLEDAGLKVGKIIGKVSAKQREIYKTEFQEGDLNVILINNAGAESLNLQAAGYLIFYDLPWSIGDYFQIQGRAHRLGSKHGQVVIYHFLVQDSVDMYKMGVLEKKKDLIEGVFGEFEVLENNMDDGFIEQLLSTMDLV